MNSDIQTPSSNSEQKNSSTTIISSYQISIKICYVQVMCSDHVSFELKRKSKVICTQRSYKLMFIPTLCCEYDTCFFSCWNDDFACQRCSYDQMDYDEVGMKKYKFFLIKIQVGLFQNDLLYRCIYGSWQHCF